MSRDPFRFFFIFFTLGAFACFATTAMGAKDAATLTKAVEADPSQMHIDFETYRRSIDDIFQIALMTSPSVQGINGIILDLNRQAAERPEDPIPLVSLGHVYRLLGQPAEANRFYKKALDLDPENFHLNMFSALTHFQQEDFEGAYKQLSHALEIQPGDVSALVARGQILMLMHRFEEAHDDLEKAVMLAPKNRQALMALSFVDHALGQNEKALEFMERLRQQDPKDPFIRYHTGALLLVMGRTQEGLQIWEGLFHEGIRDPQFLFNLAIGYLEAGKAERAQKILNHLNFFFPNETDVELLMAEGYRQMGQLSEAERRYRLILAEHPEYLIAYAGLAEVLKAQGRYKEREKILEQARSYARQEAEGENLDRAQLSEANQPFVKETS